ncbi:MAG: hypothetical protein Q8Q41_00415 [bacterium]|nr:hypothetical protein [bacterium]
MLLSMLIMGGILLGASTLAGLLMLYQIRAASNAGQSAQAIFAADTGIEWELYKALKDPGYPKPMMSNGTSFTTSYIPATSTPPDSESVRSIGTGGRTSRAFEIFFEGATSTLP